MAHISRRNPYLFTAFVTANILLGYYTHLGVGTNPWPSITYKAVIMTLASVVITLFILKCMIGCLNNISNVFPGSSSSLSSSFPSSSSSASPSYFSLATLSYTTSNHQNTSIIKTLINIINNYRIHLTLVTAILIGVITFIVNMSSHGLWCVYPLQQRIQMCDLAHQFANLMEKHNITYWLETGDMLAAVRGGKMIEWEHDIDFCTLDQDYEKIVTLLQQSHHSPPFHTIIEPNGLQRRFRIYLNQVHVENANNDHFGHSGPVMVDQWKCSYEDIKTTKFVRVPNYCNGHSFPIPDNAESLLVSKFGSNWRTPRYDNHYAACTLWYDGENPVPGLSIF